MSYHHPMRGLGAIHKLLLVTLLVASNVVFAAHVTAHHVTSKVSTCDWCVCQGQTPAGPLAVAEQVCAEVQSGILPAPAVVAPPPASHSRDNQPRAPPVII
jgi:hypothetical protein